MSKIPTPNEVGAPEPRVLSKGCNAAAQISAEEGKKITIDCVASCGLTERTIRAFWPTWIKNPDHVKGGKAAQMIRAEQKEQQKQVQKVLD